jgi:hypothetical protein
MTSRVLITDYAWPGLGVEAAVLGSTAEYAGRAVLASAA